MAGAGGMVGSGGACVSTADNNECTNDHVGECPDGVHQQACYTPSAIGTTCAAGYCDGSGQCIDCLACSDPECTADRCDGELCDKPNLCKSGTCEQSRCCNEACAGPCKACDRQGTEGTCTRMPLGLQVSGCSGIQACTSAGACGPRMNSELGRPCTGSSSCMSGNCTVGTCRSKVYEPCIEHVECATNLCDPESNTCRPCDAGPGSVPCPTGANCIDVAGTKRCQVFPGQTADKEQNQQCAEGFVSRFFCVLSEGSTCDDHAQCESRNCKSGFCAPKCTKDAECAAGTTCDTGWGMCKLPKGSPCYEASVCAGMSPVCAGFPPTCQ